MSSLSKANELEMYNFAAECLKTIAHPKRLEIIGLLEKGAMCVSDIVEAVGLSQSVTSDHLRLMEARGILNARKEGRMVFYSLGMDELSNIMACVRSKNLKRSG